MVAIAPIADTRKLWIISGETFFDTAEAADYVEQLELAGEPVEIEISEIQQ